MVKQIVNGCGNKGVKRASLHVCVRTSWTLPFHDIPHIQKHLGVEDAEPAEGHRVDKDEVHPGDVDADVRGVHPHFCEATPTHFHSKSKVTQ